MLWNLYAFHSLLIAECCVSRSQCKPVQHGLLSN